MDDKERWREEPLRVALERVNMTQEELRSLNDLRAALSEGDCETVARYLKKGQSLNVKVPYVKPIPPNDMSDYDYPLLIQEIRDENETAVFTLLAFKDTVDLDVLHKNELVQTTPLAAAVSRNLSKVVEALLMAGVSVVHPEAPFREYHHPFSLSTYRRYKGERRKQQFKMALRLLSCGVEPWFYKWGDVYNDYSLIDEVSKVAHEWLTALLCAKSCFTRIFDDHHLERLLAEFVYNQHHLEQFIRENEIVQQKVRKECEFEDSGPFRRAREGRGWGDPVRVQRGAEGRRIGDPARAPEHRAGRQSRSDELMTADKDSKTWRGPDGRIRKGRGNFHYDTYRDKKGRDRRRSRSRDRYRDRGRSRDRRSSQYGFDP